MQTGILKNTIEVTDALAELGLARETLIDAVCAGEAARDACTPNDPTNAPGFFSYAATTRRLRELLIPEGWTSEGYENLALAVSPCRRWAIAVSLGDEGTGTEYPVRTKYPKGSATQRAVEANQLDLFREPDDLEENGGWQTWLLVRRREGNVLRCELSLPEGVGPDDRVDRWMRRILLGSVSFEPRIDDGDEDSSEIVIDVPRR